MSWDDDLWAEQRNAAGYTRGNRVLLAGPGTGKTFVLVRRIEYLVTEHDIDPRRITALTFTRAAAAEMRDRLQARLGELGSRVKVSTLHSYALRELLKAGGEEFPQPLRVVGDWEERWVVIEELARLLSRRVRDISNDRGTGALDRLADDWDTLAIDDHGWEVGFADPEFLSAWRSHREVYGYTLRSELVYQLLVELRASAGISTQSPDRHLCRR
jgi:DNA helicase-2/ATP-dependent DNA helicase PcrA